MSINIKYLKENNLYDAHKHFMALSEAYLASFPEDELTEDENDNMPQQDNPMGGGMPQDPNSDQMNGAPMNGGMPQDPNMPQQDNPMGDEMPQDPTGGMDAPMDGGMPQDPTSGMDDMADGTTEDDSADDGNVIDINDLTKAQEKLNVKQNHIGRDLSKVDNRIDILIKTIGSLLKRVEDNNVEIESLKSEFEKRNPTQTEKLNLRSLDSYPFNVKPTEYWAQKASEGGYEAYADNDEPTTKEYVITNDDVDNPSYDVANTFFNIDDNDIQTLEKIFKL